ncbi:MAG: Ig-like domain-containing protein [Clostridiales bacterium]|nr:Ig-like domain-containing protein [Clostridiales bacterium]
MLKKLLLPLLLFVPVLFVLTLLAPVNANALCVSSTVLQPVAKYTHSGGTQGMCIADGYCIEAQTNSDYAKTHYVIYNLENDATTDFYYSTKHSNSLAYNAKRQEIACVSDGVVYLFHFENGKMSYKSTRKLSEHFVKVSCIDGVYYLSTGIQMFCTEDFNTMTRIFLGSERGINQGMGTDGEYLYICWYKYNSANTISVMSTSGELIQTYTVSQDLCREIEEVDFYNGDLYLNVNSNGSQNGIYVVQAEHDMTGWKTVEEANCTETGKRTRTCKTCGYVEEETIEANGEHDYKVTKTVEATCTKAGKKVSKCTVCGEKKEETISPTGHDFGSWTLVKQADTEESKKVSRVCSVCGAKEVKTMGTLKNKVEIKYKPKIISPTSSEQCLEADSNSTVTWESSDQDILYVTKDGRMLPRGTGTVTVTASSGGASDSFEITVSWFVLHDESLQK